MKLSLLEILQNKHKKILGNTILTLFIIMWIWPRFTFHYARGIFKIITENWGPFENEIILWKIFIILWINITLKLSYFSEESKAKRVFNSLFLLLPSLFLLHHFSGKLKKGIKKGRENVKMEEKGEIPKSHFRHKTKSNNVFTHTFKINEKIIE